MGRLCNVVLLFIAGIVLAGCAAGQGKLNPRTATFERENFTPPAVAEEALPGGVKVFMLEDHDIPLVRLYLSFRGGAVYDPPGKKGLSDVLSTLWRTGGTKESDPATFDERVDALAAELSVGLGRDTGFASLSVLSEELEGGLDLMRELLLEPRFDEGVFEWAKAKERAAVSRVKDNPSSLAFREFRRYLYKGHPRGVITTEESVANVTREDVVNLHRQLTTESGWVIGAVGDFEPAALFDALTSHFGALPAKGGSFLPLDAPPDPEPVLVLVEKETEQSTLLWGALAPKVESSERTPMEVADQILGGSGFQSRLMREIRSDRGLAYGVGSFYSPFKEFGVMGMSGETGFSTTREVWELMAEEAGKLASFGVTEGEVELVKNTVANSYIFRYRDPANLVLERMGSELSGLPKDLAERFMRELDMVTVDDVSEAAKNFKVGEGIWIVVGKAALEDEPWPGWRVERVKP